MRVLVCVTVTYTNTRKGEVMEDDLMELTRTLQRAKRIKDDSRLLFGIGSQEYAEARISYRTACADLRAYTEA